ncbi:roadblock/LC7 domain-containing protein [Streptomyces sp. NPDC054775]
MTDTVTNQQLAWMLDNALEMPETHSAILVSADGMLRAHSKGIGRDEAERQAAALAGLQSISRATAEFCESEAPAWRQTMVDFVDGYVFLIAAGSGAYLAVSASADVDVEAVTFRMHKLVDRVGKELTSPPRYDNPDATV